MCGYGSRPSMSPGSNAQIFDIPSNAGKTNPHRGPLLLFQVRCRRAENDPVLPACHGLHVCFPGTIGFLSEPELLHAVNERLPADV